MDCVYSFMGFVSVGFPSPPHRSCNIAASPWYSIYAQFTSLLSSEWENPLFHITYGLCQIRFAKVVPLNMDPFTQTFLPSSLINSKHICCRTCKPSQAIINTKKVRIQRLWFPRCLTWNLLNSSVHGIFQARTLEWVAISFTRGSFRTQDCFLHWWVDSLPLNHQGSSWEQLTGYNLEM